MFKTQVIKDLSNAIYDLEVQVSRTVHLKENADYKIEDGLIQTETINEIRNNILNAIKLLDEYLFNLQNIKKIDNVQDDTFVSPIDADNITQDLDNIDEILRKGMLTMYMARFLEASVKAKLNSKLVVEFNDGENSKGSIDFSFRDPIQSTGISFTEVEDFEFTEGEWVHVSFTYKLTSSADMALYINGKLVQELNTNSSSYSILWPMTWYDEYIIMVGGPAFSRASLNAYIDKVQFYKKALSQSEIVESMTTPLLSDASLLGYWDFEEGSTTDTEGYMLADNGTIKATMYKILQEDDISCGSQIQSFTFGAGVNPELELLGVEDNIVETPKTKAYVSNESLIIENVEGINSVVVYDAMGREILTSIPSSVEKVVSITLPNVKGLLIVKVNNEVVKIIK